MTDNKQQIVTLGCDIPILMYDGSNKKVQNIVPGDKIMGTNSKPIIVKSITTGQDEMYDVIPVRGIKYTVGQDHMLVLKASNYEMVWWDKGRERYRIRWLENLDIKEKSFSVTAFKTEKNALQTAKHYLKEEIPYNTGYIKYGDVIKIKAKDYHNLTKRKQAAFKGFSTGLDFEEKKADVDPYALGYWLGDGNTDTTGFTTEDKEILEYLKIFANNLGLQITNSSYLHYDVTTGTSLGGAGRNPWRNFLKKYNLLGDKHIPNDFKFNSKENRLKLLAGLIDSDGYLDENIYDFCLKSEKLTDDIIFLARSLGFYVAGKQKVKKTCTNAPGGPKEGDYFRFCICGEGLEEIPVLLSRKKAHERMSAKDANVNGVKVVPIGKKTYHSIELE